MEWRKKVANKACENLARDILRQWDNGEQSVQLGAGVVTPAQLTFSWQKVDGTNSSTYYDRFKRRVYSSVYNVKHNFGSFKHLFQISKEIDNLYHGFMNPHLEKCKDNDKICVDISHPNLVKDIFISPFRKINYRKSDFFNALYEVAQSNESFLLDGHLKIKVSITEAVEGSHKSKYSKAPQTLNEKLKKSRSVILVENEDEGCAFHALSICINKYELQNNPKEWQRIRRDTKKARTIHAQNLASKCGLTLNKAVTIDDFPNIQKHIDFQIIIIDSKNYKNKLYVGEQKDKQVYLLLNQTVEEKFHFDAIINIHAYIGLNYYCHYCFTAYNVKNSHKCDKICEKCLQNPPCEKVEPTFCNDCKFTFHNKTCFNNHIIGEKSICKTRKFCHSCMKEFNEEKHNCDEKTCHHCNEKFTLEKHFCYLKKLDMKKLQKQDQKNKIIVAYDIECQQNKTDNDVYNHVPDLLVSMTTCDLCWDYDTNKRKVEICDFCGEHEKIFFGYHCIKNFGNYIYNDLSKKAASNETQVYVFAHNAKGYDNHFVLRDLFNRGFTQPEMITSGSKVLRACVGNVKFLDSLLIFQQPLASLPKAFGFEHLVKKGHFPHLFHTSENMNYIGPLPDIKYFNTKYLKKEALLDLNEWYQTKINELQGKNWDLKEDMISYCKNDVVILLKCLQSFRRIFKEATELDPITRCFTLASMGLEMFRAKILPPNTIGVTPIRGYSNRGTFSMAGNIWLDYMEKENNIKIEREVPIDNFIVDGYDSKNKTVYEYNGCHFHAHHCIYPDNRDEPMPYKRRKIDKDRPFNKCFDKVEWEDCTVTANERYQSTLDKATHLRKRKFNVIEEWDCSVAKRKKTDPFYKSYNKTRQEQYHLIKKHGGVDVREAFFGGRTNNIRFWCDTSDKTEYNIKYYDFRSLYPTVLKYEEFPMGHPIVINENFDDLASYFGFVKCIVQPPTNLYIPVLPYKTKNKKLVFPLCSECAEEQNQKSCEHNAEQRQLIGTWTTEELKYAVDNGYKIVKFIEVYHYPQKSDQIFREYINLWLRFKQEADGWPSWVKCEEDKDRYIAEFKEREGIELRKDHIKKNPGLRFIAKLFLNTLWGKLAQRPNLVQTTICNTYDDYWKLTEDENITIKGEIMVNEETLIVSHVQNDDENCKNGNTSLAIAAFVTSWARLKLVKLIHEIEKVQGRILYMDTDSVIFTHREATINEPAEPEPKTGDFLGDLADEITKDYGVGAKCTQFVSLGPKFYAFKVLQPGCIQPKISIKAKGITLTNTVMDIVNFDTMKELATEYVDNEGDEEICGRLSVPQMLIRPTKLHSIETKNFDKKIRAYSTKRRIFIDGDENNTLPYGWID